MQRNDRGEARSSVPVPRRHPRRRLLQPAHRNDLQGIRRRYIVCENWITADLPTRYAAARVPANRSSSVGGAALTCCSVLNRSFFAQLTPTGASPHTNSLVTEATPSQTLKAACAPILGPGTKTRPSSIRPESLSPYSLSSPHPTAMVLPFGPLLGRGRCGIPAAPTYYTCRAPA